MSEVKGELICVYQFLNSHQKSVWGWECDVEVEGLEDLELPFDDVLLSELRISGGGSDYILK